MQPLAVSADILPALFSAESFAGIIFLITVGLVVSGAVIAVVSKRLVRAVSGLAICFTGLAGIYYFLLSPFVAMMQMLIYVGAVSILIAFGIMMATPEDEVTPDNKGEVILRNRFGGMRYVDIPAGDPIPRVC